ncbi:hypothetical protein BJ508DRAFT_329660 [Ascobolus immersus RN42]|uniref:Uncharacterized protein n=1 Tax=Ascobolus immersus RN42 TaxID=1160509 RepID=A0A3N4I8A0_ASCIM|nr:hypothetical protein BJ508DRAFT_329660 [Ascobolus immersus RN42]
MQSTGSAELGSKPSDVFMPVGRRRGSTDAYEDAKFHARPKTKPATDDCRQEKLSRFAPEPYDPCRNLVEAVIPVEKQQSLSHINTRTLNPALQLAIPAPGQVHSSAHAAVRTAPQLSVSSTKLAPHLLTVTDFHFVQVVVTAAKSWKATFGSVDRPN